MNHEEIKQPDPFNPENEKLKKHLLEEASLCILSMRQDSENLSVALEVKQNSDSKSDNVETLFLKLNQSTHNAGFVLEDLSKFNSLTEEELRIYALLKAEYLRGKIKLAQFISTTLLIFVNSTDQFNNNELKKIKNYIILLKNHIIPIFEESEMTDLVKKYEGLIIQVEIKITSDEALNSFAKK